MGRKRRASGHRKPTRTQRRPELTGTVHLTDAGAEVATAEGAFRISSRGLREVMDGDTVSVSLGRGSHGERRAFVESVLVRAHEGFVGTFDLAGPLGVVRPLDARLKADFFVLPGDTSPTRLGIAPGDIVAARIESYPTRYESGVVTLTRRVGGADAPDAGIQCVMARYDLADGYPEGPVRAADALDLAIEAALEDPLRRDIRDRFAFTIDPVDARDFDDALSIVRRADGGFALGVHIADVSHYVRWEDAIDLEARRRSTSVYLADRVLPMLPERLSCDICSLVAGADRLAMTVDVDLDAQGAVERATIYPSVIRSRVRLSYDQADRLLAQDAAAGAELTEALETARELAHARQRIRYARGAVDFETVEVHAVLDDDGLPTELGVRRKTEATALVEEAMLIANECVAEFLARRGVAAAFRVHEPPTPDRLHDTARTLAELGICDRTRTEAVAAGDQAAMRAVLEGVRGTARAEVVNALLLRSMQRACYRAHNEGHYALGARAYCHFTSPIRRYPDLLVHRALKRELARTRLGARAVHEREPQLTGTGSQRLDEIAPQLCRHASARERVADAAAHASQKVKAAQYYATRLGTRDTGTVAWIDTVGAFVRLDATAAEGLVHLRDLGDEWFDFNERTLTLTGSATGRTLSVGDRVVVEVAGVNPVRGHIDLALVHAPSHARPGHALH